MKMACIHLRYINKNGKLSDEGYASCTIFDVHSKSKDWNNLKVFVTNKTKGPKQDRYNRLSSQNGKLSDEGYASCTIFDI
jgi:hypothetical protein